MKKNLSLSNYLRSVLTIFFVCLFVVLNAQTAIAPSLGDGTSGNPFQIASLENLYWIASDTANNRKHYAQTNNINASETSTWFSGAGWIPIGEDGKQFRGTYNGKGHVINGLFINRPASNSIGLFGALLNTAVIDSLGVTNLNITGLYFVGGLVGYSWSSTVKNCYTTGIVTGKEAYVGGLMGYSYLSSSVSNSYSTVNVSGKWLVGGLIGNNTDLCTTINCYSKGNVSGSYYIGGLVGYNSGSSIVKCYSTGRVTGDTDFGGLVGFNNSSVISSFWDTETSGLLTSFGGTGKNTAEMTNPVTFIDAHWGNTVWYMGDGINNGYPYLKWQNPGGTPIPPIKATAPSAGDGTPGNPFQIATLENLYWIASINASSNYNYIQIADINASETANWFNGEGWMPIRSYSLFVDCYYNGKGHVIDSLFINRPTTDNIGLFGSQTHTLLSYTIDSLGVTNANITGHDNVGALSGYNQQLNYSVNNCFSSGSVTGNNNVGGLIGHNLMTSMSTCYSTASVIGNYYVGGLVGQNTTGQINKSYSFGNVTGYFCVGGLVGRNINSPINNSYSSGSVNGRSSVGGLVGDNNHLCTISNCYSTGSVSSYSYVGGLLGRNDDNCTVNNCYSTGRVTGTNWVGGLAASNISSSITNCFWDTITSGRSPSEGGTGKNTLEMKTLSTFINAGWDFINETANGINEIWGIGININNGYPYLNWQPSITNVYSIFDNVVPDGESTCINAWDTIIVAGVGTTVEFLSGSTVNLIAGKSIRFLSGLHALEGCVINAQITTNGLFCDGSGGSPIVVQPQQKSSVTELISDEKPLSYEKNIKIFPNPNNGQFTIEFTNIESTVTVCIYNMLGAKVYQSSATTLSSHKINLPGLRKGIYFVKVMDGKEQMARKMVVN